MQPVGNGVKDHNKNKQKNYFMCFDGNILLFVVKSVSVANLQELLLVLICNWDEKANFQV